MSKSQLLITVFIFFIWLTFGVLSQSVAASQLLPFSAEHGDVYQRAEKGDPKAEFQIATFYEQTIPPDYEQIELWLNRSARKGYVEAQYALGNIYHYGKKSIAPDTQKAEYWYLKAASQGDKQALSALEKLRVQQDYKMLSAPTVEDNWNARWLLSSATMGDTTSQFEVAKLYEDGIKVRMDYEQAVKWYEKAAVSGHIEAMFRLATMYQEGKGTNADIDKAIFWFEQAAIRDYNPAQRKLYEIYDKGQDTMQDLTKAAGWLYVSLADLFPKEKDLTKVSPELEELFKQMTAQEKDRALLFAFSFIDEKRVRK